MRARSPVAWLTLPPALAVACGVPAKPHAQLPSCPPPSASAAPSAAPAVSPPWESPGGMWLPQQLPAHAATLKRLGLEVPAESLADPLKPPLAAVVSLGGCSASFVSAEGLLVTNHHCVTGALQFNSKPGQDLLADGFLARTREEERSIGPTGRVFVTRAFRDVTSTVREGIDGLAEPRQRQVEVERRTKALVAECERDRAEVRCEVASYYGGAQFFLIEKLALRDIRLVYAPAAGIGNYGGEVDNWRWPRHTGDFAFYRAWVGADGKPADHAAGNVPYRPPHHLRVARQPLAAGDLVMVAGYPGRTTRLTPAAEVREAVEWWYPRRVEAFEAYLAAIARASEGDDDTRLRATPLRRGLDNALTYTRGSLEGLTRGGSLARREELEVELRAWVAADPARQAAHGGVFEALDAFHAERARTRELDACLAELTSFSSLLGAATTLVRMAEERPKADAERKPDLQARNWPQLEQAQQALEKRYSARLDRALLALAFERAARRLEGEQRARLLAPLLGRAAPTPEAIARAVDALFAKTRLGETPLRLELLRQGTTAALARHADPVLRLAVALRPLQLEQERRQETETGVQVTLRPRYVTALRAFRAGEVAPDANGTLRVTFGTVQGYRPTPEAELHAPFTTLAGVVAKATGKDPFRAPEALLGAARAAAESPYHVDALGDVPVDFLSNCDITGGNSGSATLDARGELVGLAFDGNYEAMASDWGFLPQLSRSIHVDVRYLLWVLAEVDHADALLAELGVAPGARKRP